MMHVVASVLGRFGGNRVTARPGTFNPLAPDFWAPLSDAGAGAVNTTLLRGTGPATFTRATAAACRLSTGLWKLDVASGTARSHYHEFSPGVMTYGGYLAEPAATQLALNPRDMTQAAWVAVNVTAAQDGVGIDGVTNSCTRLTSDAIGGSVQQTVVAAGSSRTYSCFIKRVSGTGTITINQGATTLDVTASVNSTTFTLVQLNANVLNAAFGITFGASGDVILVDCNQFEAGAVATTPIPAAGSRAVDILTYPFSGNAEGATGTAYAEIVYSGTFAGFAIGTTTGGTRPLGQNSSVTSVVIGDGTTVVTKSGLSSALTGVRKRASSWGALGQVITGDGATVSSGAFDGDMGSTAIAIGSNSSGGNHFIGSVMNARIWRVQAANSQLQGITS